MPLPAQGRGLRYALRPMQCCGAIPQATPPFSSSNTSCQGRVGTIQTGAESLRIPGLDSLRAQGIGSETLPTFLVRNRRSSIYEELSREPCFVQKAPNEKCYKAHPYICSEGDGERPRALFEKRTMGGTLIMDHRQVRELGRDYVEWNKHTILDAKKYQGHYHWRPPCDQPASSVFSGLLPLLASHSAAYRSRRGGR